MSKKDYVLPSLKEAGRRSKEETKIIREDIFIPDSVKEYGENKKYYVRTYGCQANERDGETIGGILEMMKYQRCECEEDADIIVLNTCAIRENAHDKVFGEVGSLKKMKENNPNLIVCVCGCMVQQDGAIEKLLKSYSQIDIIFGTHNIHNLPSLILNHLRTRSRSVEVFSKEGEVYENLPIKRDSNLKAWVNIMYGCDKFCTYCIVPYTRGKERSRLKEDIIEEVIDLKNKGYKEITLLGQNVNAYGKNLGLGYDFADLLEEVAKTGIERIRFTTSHPWNFTDRMIDMIAKYDNLMPYIHLPLQSGDDNMLVKMNRRYTIEEYKRLHDYIREKIPGVAVSTDIIVGFPNESEEQFQHTLDLVDYCKFDSAFTFIFSPREGTPASRMKDEVSAATKLERFNRLLDKVATYANLRNQDYIGKTVKVLVEGESKKNSEILSGYSENNKLVNFKGKKSSIGKIVNVYIDSITSWTLQGYECE